MGNNELSSVIITFKDKVNIKLIDRIASAEGLEFNSISTSQIKMGDMKKEKFKKGRSLALVNSNIPVVSTKLTPGMVQMLKEEDEIESIENDPYVFVYESKGGSLPKITTAKDAVQQYPIPWGVQQIDADIAWDYSRGGGVKVAVIDTGIDKTHLDLNENVKGGISFVEGFDAYDDDNGHGTHCAGIIAANNSSKEGILGVAPNADLYSIKALTYNGVGKTSSIILGIDWCINEGMDIISLSLGSPGNETPPSAYAKICTKAWETGIIIVAAAGNDHADHPEWGISYPAHFNTVISVGATDHYDDVAHFSNRGEELEIVAPGVDILSTYISGRYRIFSGTSQACPHVSGVLALAKSRHNNMDNNELRVFLQRTVDPLGAYGADEVYGYGLVNALKIAKLEEIPESI